MAHPLDGVSEKLKRADESIRNLEIEIATFLKGGAYPAIPNRNDAVLDLALKLHTARAIPFRFSVLAGEIVHHWRASMDHIAWLLSGGEYRAEHPGLIEFPIFRKKPIEKDELSRYERKVKGISDERALAVIEAVQPYNRRPDPLNDPLLVIHNMDTIDKHRELVMAISAFDIQSHERLVEMYREAGFPEEHIAGVARSVDMNAQITTQVSFRKFGGRKAEPVIPGLCKLARYVRDLVTVFRDNFF